MGQDKITATGPNWWNRLSEAEKAILGVGITTLLVTLIVLYYVYFIKKDTSAVLANLENWNP